MTKRLLVLRRSSFVATTSNELLECCTSYRRTCVGQQSRAAFLSDASHRIVFYYTPKHSSWLNQIEIWLSILVRKLLKRGSFTSVDDLKVQVVEFTDYYNRTMAKPFRWTYQGKPLVP